MMLTTTRYRFWSYDVWGNENDGFEVNDVYSSMAVVNIDERISDDDICECNYCYEPTESIICDVCWNRVSGN